MAENTVAHETRTFQSSPRGRLVGGLLIVAVAVGCLAIAAASPPPGLTFRIVWALIWILFALFGIRLARLATKVRGNQLVVRGLFRTRRLDASQISKIELVRIRQRRQVNIYMWFPRAYLRNGGSVRLSGLGAGGSSQPASLAADVEEITALLKLQALAQ